MATHVYTLNFVVEKDICLSTALGVFARKRDAVTTAWDSAGGFQQLHTTTRWIDDTANARGSRVVLRLVAPPGTTPAPFAIEIRRERVRLRPWLERRRS